MNPHANNFQPQQFNMSPQMNNMLSPAVHGRKRAVLYGITYRGHPKSLKGSTNDVLSMRYFLVEKLGFPNTSVLVLTEDERDLYKYPTKANIRSALRWHVHSCQPGDSLVFHYSGHGTQVRDQDGDEIDGNDESLCPVDYETEGRILDDEISNTIVQDPDLTGVSRLLVDEIHERGMNEDFLLIILHELLPQRSDLHLILMSLFFQGLTYPVAELFLENVLEKKIGDLGIAAIQRKSLLIVLV
ncbi:Metacaspase-2 [Capsicum chinense]|nr:Metacaspase-2 [Capsicum chinense]